MASTPPPPPPPPLRIAIVGGGPAGLTLGVLLHNKNIPFTIYELSRRPTEDDLAKPAGSLDMHEGTGLAAIRECGLYSEFQSLTGDCSEAQKLFNRDGNLIYEDDGGPRERPEISRHKLIKMLLSRVPDSAIQWDHKLLGATRVATGVELDFGARGKHTVDLVIGADGAWSKVRTLLTDTRPIYSGIQNITLNLRNITTSHSHLGELIGDGSFTSLGNRHGVCSQRSVQDSARIYIFLTTDDEHFGTTTSLKGSSPSLAKTFLMDNECMLKKWGGNIKELVAAACDDEAIANQNQPIYIKPLYRLPVGHSWEHKRDATLIGDAAHLMCPWAGEGVNLAMKDSLSLAQAIAKAYEVDDAKNIALQRQQQQQQALEPLVKNFEVEMWARAEETAQETLQNGEMMFGSDDGAAKMRHFFESVMPPQD